MRTFTRRFAPGHLGRARSIHRGGPRSQTRVPNECRSTTHPSSEPEGQVFLKRGVIGSIA